MTTVFYTFRDSPQRKAALASPPGSPERYVLLGLDELRERGLVLGHNLEREEAPPRWARVAGGALKLGLERAGGYGGDFATVLASLRRLNAADVVLSTVDTVGIPLVLLKRAGRVTPPLVYIAVGLPERLAQLRSERMRRLYASSLARSAAIVAYSEYEAGVLRGWLAERGEHAPVEFLPFGVDLRRFRPSDGKPGEEVVSIGADPHRDFELLARVAARMPHAKFRIVATADHVRALHDVPGNVRLEADVRFETMRERLVDARVVALPVRENSYSGATTVLLQAMASGKPVVVTRTRAVATGYGLVDGENCRLVAPGDAEAFERALGEVLHDEATARALGERARETAERELSWERYVNGIEALLRAAAAGRADGRSPPS